MEMVEAVKAPVRKFKLGKHTLQQSDLSKKNTFSDLKNGHPIVSLTPIPTLPVLATCMVKYVSRFIAVSHKRQSS